MSFNFLLQKFDALGTYQPGMVIPIGLDFTNDIELFSIMGETLQAHELSMKTVTANRTSTQLTLDGTMDILGITAAQTKLIAADLNGKLHLTIEVVIPPGWKFSQSFTDLPLVPQKYPESGAAVKDQAFLNGLSFGACKLVFTNIAHHSKTYSTDLVAGVNFVGELMFLGALLPFGTLSGNPGPITIKGPVREYSAGKIPTAFMGIRLQSDLNMNFSAAPIPVSNTKIYVKSPLYEGQFDPEIDITRMAGVYFSADATMMNRPVSLVGKLANQAGGTIAALYGRFTDFSMSGFS
ncbi:MAG: hypothetical protein AAF570_05955, partial [Bacteroidota bacterium]